MPLLIFIAEISSLAEMAKKVNMVSKTLAIVVISEGYHQRLGIEPWFRPRAVRRKQTTAQQALVNYLNKNKLAAAAVARPTAPSNDTAITADGWLRRSLRVGRKLVARRRRPGWLHRRSADPGSSAASGDKVPLQEVAASALSDGLAQPR
jgi:hypothetical protein